MEAGLVWAVGVLLLALGYVGCVVPVLPGPLLAYGALWWLHFCRPEIGMDDKLVVGGIAVAVVSALDYLLPAVFARRFKCSGWGTAGCLVGTVAGLFFAPLGIVLGPFLGAVAGELVAGRGLAPALKGGVGALLGFVFGVVLKFSAVALMTFWYFMALAD